MRIANNVSSNVKQDYRDNYVEHGNLRVLKTKETYERVKKRRSGGKDCKNVV